MTPLRPLLLTGRFWPQAGAAESIVARLAVGLQREGAQPTILSTRWHPSWPRVIDFYGVRVVRLGPPPGSRWQMWHRDRAWRRWLTEHERQFDAVYVAGLRHEAAAAVRVFGGRKPVILAPLGTGRDGDCFWQVTASEGERIKRHCLRATALVAYHAALRRDLEAAGYPRSAIHDVPLGVPLLPPRTADTRAAARALLADANGNLQLAPRVPVVVSTCRLGRDGGWDDLLLAWPAVARRWPSARLWLAGECDDRDGVLRRIQTLGLTGQAMVVGRFDDLEGLLAAGDIFVAPSQTGSPLGVAEACAAAMACIAADVPAHRALLRDCDDLLFVPPHDPTALSAAILSLLDNPARAGRLSAALYDHAAREFSLERMIERHEELFRS